MRTLAGAVGVVVLMGCGTAETEGGDGPAGDVGSSATGGAGAPASGASAGTGGDGVAGQVSGGGTAGSATGGSATGGSGGAASGGSAGQVSPDATLVRAAVVTGSCIQDDGVNRHLTDMYDPAPLSGFYSRWGMQAPCLAMAGSGCGAVEQCLGYTVELYDGPCEPCTGDVTAFCGNGYRVTVDCSTIGLQCHPIASCADVVPAVTCDEASYSPSCTAAGAPQYCYRGAVMTGRPCSDLGLDCVDGECVGTGGACGSWGGEPGDPVWFEGIGCDGQNLHACVEGRTHVRDCTSIHPDFSCQTVEGMFFCGLDSECVPGDVDMGTHGTEEYCEGTELVFCNAGRVARIDCTELGFAGCDVDSAYGCTPTLPAE